MEYKNRTYREHLQRERWHSFTVTFKETDLWIGIDAASFQAEIRTFTETRVRALREEMDTYLAHDRDYLTALIAYEANSTAPVLLREMSEVSYKSGIGPMSAVAGAVSQQIGREIKARFGIKEIIVENGGDIYADIQSDIDIAVFAGQSPLSEKVGLTIKAEYSPLGICTSSGTVGPSLSFGKADAVMIICKDCALADTFATAFANQIQTPEDIALCMEKIERVDEILAAICIKDDKIGILGEFPLKVFNIRKEEMERRNDTGA